jgi:hypothetical protein
MFMIEFYSSLVAAIVLAAIALIHVYWAGGGFFPGKDANSLAQTVVGGKPGMAMPPVFACLVVAGLLLIAAWVVLVVGGVTPAVLSLELHKLAAFGLCAVLFLRGAGGFFDARLRPEIKGSPYEKLNLSLYSPLCLTLAALVLITVWNA